MQEIFALFLALNIRTYTKFESQNTPYIGGGAGGAGGSVAPTPLPPPKKQITNIGGKNPPFHVLVLEDTFTDVFDITCDMADFKAHIHIFCSQTTCELSKAPSTHIRRFLYPQIFLCGYKKICVHM